MSETRDFMRSQRPRAKMMDAIPGGVTPSDDDVTRKVVIGGPNTMPRMDMPTPLPPAPTPVDPEVVEKLAKIGDNHPPLAQPDPNGEPAATARITEEAIDKATDNVIKQMQLLQGEIDHLIAGIEENRQRLHTHMRTHFALGAEAAAFRQMVVDRLARLTE